MAVSVHPPQPALSAATNKPSTTASTASAVSKPPPATKHGSRPALLSPVNQNGSFECDRVIRAGMVQKRTRHTKTWKATYLVLRPLRLSVYGDADQTQLRHQIALSDMTAVARQKDPRRKMSHTFAVFTPARAFHFGVLTERDLHAWLDAIAAEARLAAAEDDVHGGVDDRNLPPATIAERLRPAASPSIAIQNQAAPNLPRRDVFASSSSDTEPAGPLRPAAGRGRPFSMHSATGYSSLRALASSMPDYGSASDLSDVFPESSLSLSVPSQPTVLAHPSSAEHKGKHSNSALAGERVVHQGWLCLLRTKGGVRQWRKVWAVLRARALALYKSDDEYSASLIVPFSAIIDAVELDPISHSKRFCLQLISDVRSYRFAAPDEHCLDQWLGAFKCMLGKRRGADARRSVALLPSTAENAAVKAQPPLHGRPAN